MRSRTGTDSAGAVVAIDGFFDGSGRKAVAVVVLALFSTCLIGTSAWDALRPAPVRKLMGREKEEEDARRARADWRDGTLAALVEYDLKNASAARRFVMPRYAALLFELLGEAKGEAVLGRDGFLFTADRIGPRRAPESELVSLPANLVSAVARRLRAAGVELVAAPVPRKAAVYATLLPRTARPRPELEGAFVAEARRRGVVVADLQSAFARASGRPVYYHADTHWNNFGMMLAAEEIAREARIEPTVRPATLRIENLGRMTQPGDIARMIGLDPDEVCIDPGKFEAWDVVAADSGLPWQPKLDDPCAATLLAGTSFTALTAFPRFVAYAFGGDVLDFGRHAVGPIEPLRSGLAAAAAAGCLPVRAIWEIPAHNLFCVGVPLSGAASIFGALPPVETTPATVRGQASFPERDQLRPGTIEVGARRVRTELRASDALFAGDGRAGVRLEGEVTEPVEITVDSGSYLASAVWAPGRGSLFVPVLGAAEVRLLRVAAQAPKAASTMRLRRLDVAVLARADGVRRAAAEADAGGSLRATFAAPVLLGRDDVLVVEADAGRGGVVTCVVLDFADGSQRAYDFPSKKRTALAVPDLADREGFEVASVLVVSEGGRGASAVAEVRPPLRPSRAVRPDPAPLPPDPGEPRVESPTSKPGVRPSTRSEPTPRAATGPASRPSSRAGSGPAATSDAAFEPPASAATKPTSRPRR